MRSAQKTRPLNLFVIAMIALWLVGCSGGSSAPPVLSLPPPVADAPEEEETLYIGLTDAEGDFLEYQVVIESVKLTRENGVVVETLPLEATVDFAQYTQLTEFLTAATVPTGIYTSASIVLNYSDASIQVEDSSGNAVEAIVVDDTGAPAGQVELTIEFADREQFRIAPGIPAHITLDFDLESSHVVNLSATPVTAELTGVLLADTLLETPKKRRARGLLGAVDVTASLFELKLRPFHIRDGLFGILPVNVNQETSYEIDGVAFEGQAGLESLATLAENTYVVTFGVLDIAARTYTAQIVYAGSSVPYGDQDIVTGTVIARDGDELVLRGAVIVNTDYRVRRVSELPVTISSATSVTQMKSAFAEYFPEDISVGQRLTVLGKLQNPTGDMRFLDASEGHARLQYTQLHGLVKEASPLVLDLVSINRVHESIYNFNGTGSSATTNADPNSYEIATGSLTLDGIDINDAVKVRGFVQRFGQAPEDFLAQTLGDVSAVPGVSRALWSQDNGTGALLSANESSLVLDLSQSSAAVHLYSGQIPADMKATELPWTLSPTDSGRGKFAVITRDSRQAFTNFDEFSEAVLMQLSGGEAIREVRSEDILDIDTLTSTVRSIVVFIN